MITCAYPNTLIISEVSKEILSKYYTLHPYENQEDIPENTRVIIGTPPKVLPSNLQWLQLIAAGYDSINLQLLKDKGVLLTNGSGTTSVAIAEYVIASLLYSAKNFKSYTIQQNQSMWLPLETGKEISGTKIAILGTGHIGKEIAKRLVPFNVDVTGFNTKGSENEIFNSTYPLQLFDNYASNFDTIILALPLNESTKHFFNKERLLLLKETCTLINVGRGAVIELRALEEIIDTHLDSVVLDVMEIEPLPTSSKLWKHKKALITPHISYMSQYRNQNVERLIVDNLMNYATGKPLKNIVKNK